MMILDGKGGRYKKLKRTEDHEQHQITGEDRISNLPGDVINKILSYIHIKDAARTSVLSKDWTYKWTFISSINIDVECKPKFNIDVKFVSFMNMILNLQEIKSFRLSCRKGYNSHHLKTWISSILRHKVESLEITARECVDTIVLSQCLFDWTSLTDLKFIFGHGILEVPLNKCFSQLKSLSISGSFIDVEIQNVQTSRQLLLDFPVLEKLELNYCKWLNVESVEIKSPKLIIFKTRSVYSGFNNCVIKVSAPNLGVIEVCGCKVDDFVLCSESVSYASLLGGMSESCVFRIHRILKAVVGLKHLELSSSNVEALIQANKQGLLVLPTFDGLKHLEISGTCKVKELLEFLDSTPSIESLRLDLAYHYPTYDYKKVKVLPRCLVSHLKEVTLTRFHGWKNQVKLMEFILKNGSVLEKIIVFVYATSSKSESDIEKVLLGLAKTSTSASIVVNSREYEYNKHTPAHI